MVTARSFPGLALLPDGRVLVAGGVQPGDQTRLHSAELFDPDTQSFSPTGAMSFDGGPMGTLPDGRVFVASSPNAEVYPRALGRSPSLASSRVGSRPRPPSPMAASLSSESRDSSRLCRGVGSHGPNIPTGARRIAPAVRNDAARRWPRPRDRRTRHTAGVFDPATEQMIPVSAPAASRPASTRLLDGRVLIVGGLERTAHGPDLPLNEPKSACAARRPPQLRSPACVPSASSPLAPPCSSLRPSRDAARADRLLLR